MKILWLLLLAPVLMYGAAEWSALDLSQLRGLRTLTVEVVHLPDAMTMQRAGSEGMSELELKELVSNRLTQVGLHVVDSSTSVLWVNATAIPTSNGVIYDVSSELTQLAYLVRNSASALAVVKVGSLTGICPDDEIVSTTKENVDGFITDFVFGWLQANKKK